MTTLKQLQQLTCATCGPSLHNERGCVSCKAPHMTQTTKVPDAWMRDFVQRSNRARETAAALRNERRRHSRERAKL